VKLLFLPTAAHDLERLREFVEAKDPRAAARIASRLYAAAANLLQAPELGRPIEGTPYRKLVIRMRRSAYIMHYREREDAIVIVRIWHGREKQE
jgi:plasmid stabilization system protein ParE